MADEKRLIDVDATKHSIDVVLATAINRGVSSIPMGKDSSSAFDFLRGYERGALDVAKIVLGQKPVDAVEVVRCKDCRWAKPYERNDGETGYYCHFCGHAFKYGANWERLYTPIKEADDFCSYGERKDNERKTD